MLNPVDYKKQSSGMHYKIQLNSYVFTTTIDKMRADDFKTQKSM